MIESRGCRVPGCPSESPRLLVAQKETTRWSCNFVPGQDVYLCDSHADEVLADDVRRAWCELVDGRWRR